MRVFGTQIGSLQIALQNADPFMLRLVFKFTTLFSRLNNERNSYQIEKNRVLSIYSKVNIMQTDKEVYSKLLLSENISKITIDNILEHLQNLGLRNTQVPPDLLKKNEFGEKITEAFTRLHLSVIEGNSSWEGLLVGFPGNKNELSTKSVGTPYLRKILYPILDLHHRLQTRLDKKLPCIYFVGERFSDVFLRKFDLLKEVIPHIIVLTNDIYQCALNKSQLPITEAKDNFESWSNMKLCRCMDSKEGLLIPLKSNSINIKYLSNEVLCFEGTENPERLDILGYDKSNHSLVAFEIKGPGVGRTELENLFLQGMEHRNWIEKNKMAVKLLFDRGPRGKRINTKKRVRLLLGFYGIKVPHIFNELRKESKRRDAYTEIDFVRISKENDEVQLSRFEE